MPTLPVYIERLGGNDATVGLNIALFTVAAIVIRPLTGAALDSHGRRLFILLGLAIVGSRGFPLLFVTSTLLTGLALAMAAMIKFAPAVPRSRVSERPRLSN
ncbi:MAG TPA: hypothetical protein VGL40_06995 [Bacillota bacterium]|jgi:MFS family permease